MRRGLKNKALTIWFAWLTIFLHGVIPHNHADHSFKCTNTISHTQHHNDDQTLADTGLSAAHFENHNCEIICHFNPDLFSHADLDNNYFTETGNPAITKISLHNKKVSVIEQDCHRPPLLKNIPLRGPPLV